MKKTFIKKGVFSFLAVFSAVAAYAQTTITTGVFSPVSVCAGGTVSVPFSTTGTVTAGTVFTVQLSDAAGSFTSAVNVGTGTTSPLTATIGGATAAGTAYKLRVITTTPAVTGTASAGSLTIINPGAPTVVTPVSYIVGAPGATALTAAGATGATFNWYVDNSTLTALAGAPTPSTAAVGSEDYYVSQTVGACEGPRAKIDVNITATPTPVAGAAGPYCKDAPATALTATPSNGGTLKWYDAGNVLLPGAPVPVTSAVGSVTYYVSQVINTFESSKVSIVVTIVAPPALPTTTPVIVCKGTTAAALTATGVPGATFLWYTGPSGGTGVASLIPPTATVGTVNYYVTQTSGCESARASLAVTVNDVSAEPAVTSPLTHCASTTPAAPLAATGTAIKWYNSASALISTPTPDVNVAATTTYNYFVTQTETGKCESAKKAVTITVNKTVAPTVGTGVVEYCLNDTPAPLTATGTALIWYADASTGTALTGAALTPSTATAGSVDYYVTQTLNGCESTRVKFTVTVKARPAAPAVVNPADVCQGTTVPSSVLTASVTGTGVLWYSALTGGTGAPTAPTPVTTTSGTNDYYVTQTANGCESTPRTKVSLVIKPAPAAPTVTTPVVYCKDAVATALTATGTALKFYLPNGTLSPTVPVPSTATVGDVTYQVTQTNAGGCESEKAPLVVTTKALSPAPGVVQPSYCLNETAVPLTGNGANFSFYTGASTTTPLSGADLTPSTATVGTVDYYISQTTNGCESVRVKFTVTVKARPAAPTVANPADVCQNITVSSSVLTAAVTGTGVLWYSALTGGTGSATAPTPLTTTSGTNDYYVTQTNVGGCESAPRTKVSLVVKPAPAAPTVADVAYCKDATATALTATGTSLKYYTFSTGGTGATIAPVPLTTTVGDVTYYVTQTNAQSCESPRAALMVTTNPLPAVATVAIINPICQENPGKIYSFSATGAMGNTFNWYSTLTGGTKEAGTPSVNSATVGETTFYAVQVTNKGCESPTRVAQKIRIKKLPGAPAVTSLIEYCQFAGAAALTAIPETGASINWWGTSSTGGTVGGAPTPSTQDGGTTSFYVSQTLEACESSRAKIDVLIKTTPKPSTTTYMAFCQGAAGPTLSATGTNLKWYREINSGSQSNPFIVFTEKVEDYSFFVTQTGSNGCESPKEEIKIHIKSLPSAAISGTSSIALGESANIKLDFGGDGPWKYVLSNGTSGTATTSSINVAVSPSTTTTYVVTEVSNECGKGIPLGSAVVTVRVPTISTGNPSTAEVCAGKTIQVPFQQSGNFPDGNKFVVQISTTNEDTKFKEIPSVATSSQITATLPDTTKGGVYFVRIVSAGTFTVKGSVAGVTLIVNPLPAATISGSKTILLGESADLKIEFVGKGPWTFNLNNGTKDSSITAANTPYSFLLRPRTTTTYTVNSIVNVCGTVAKGNGSARIQVDAILGLEPASASFAKVYPTIVNAGCTIELDEAVSTKDSGVELITLNGQTVLDKKIKQKITQVDLSNYPGGLYMLRVRNGNHTSVHRIVKQ